MQSKPPILHFKLESVQEFLFSVSPSHSLTPSAHIFMVIQRICLVAFLV